MRNDLRRKEKENAIYEGVLRLIAAGADPAALRIQQIADAAGIGKGTVYEYFASKEEIWKGLADYCLDAEYARLEQALAPCRTLAETENAVLDYLAGLAQGRSAAYRVVAQVLATRTHQGAWGCPARTQLDRVRALMSQVFARLVAAGELDPALDQGYCGYAVAAACASYTMALVPHPHGESLMDPADARRHTLLLLDRALRGNAG